MMCMRRTGVKCLLPAFGFEGQTHIINTGCKPLYLLNHITGSDFSFLFRADSSLQNRATLEWLFLSHFSSLVTPSWMGPEVRFFPWMVTLGSVKRTVQT